MKNKTIITSPIRAIAAKGRRTLCGAQSLERTTKPVMSESPLKY